MRAHVAAWVPPKPSLQITNGAQHVRDAQPPDEWTPPMPVGFTQAAEALAEPEEREPLLWDGD